MRLIACNCFPHYQVIIVPGYGLAVANGQYALAEITMASHEQAQGIEHVGIAIEQMSKVAQDAADSAGQIAHAAEQTYDQAREAEAMVERGIEVVGFKLQRNAPEREDEGGGAAPSAARRVHRQPRGPVGQVTMDRSDRSDRSDSSHDAARGGKPQLRAPEAGADRHFKDF